jgi:hypothetical protein
MALMATGPVQLVVLGFERPSFLGELVAELERLRESDAVRVIDSLAVYKDADDELEVAHLSDVADEQPPERGRVVGALIGLGVEGEPDLEAGARSAAEDADAFGEPEAWDVLDDIPRDSAAALVLIEHHWAVPLRDAIARTDGFAIADGFIDSVDVFASRTVARRTAPRVARRHRRLSA